MAPFRLRRQPLGDSGSAAVEYAVLTGAICTVAFGVLLVYLRWVRALLGLAPAARSLPAEVLSSAASMLASGAGGGLVLPIAATAAGLTLVLLAVWLTRSEQRAANFLGRACGAGGLALVGTGVGYGWWLAAGEGVISQDAREWIGMAILLLFAGVGGFSLTRMVAGESPALGATMGLAVAALMVATAATVSILKAGALEADSLMIGVVLCAAGSSGGVLGSKGTGTTGRSRNA